jgi:hypothetical protein
MIPFIGLEEQREKISMENRLLSSRPLKTQRWQGKEMNVVRSETLAETSD